MTPIWYNLLLRVFIPLYRLRVWLRSHQQADYAQEAAQRFSSVHAALPSAWGSTRSVWIHAVSVGESHAAYPIIQHLLDKNIPVLVSNTTRTGQGVIRTAFAHVLDSQLCSVFLPVDTHPLMLSFINHYQPKLVVMIETELWPNLLAILKAKGITSVLMNARLSQKSARGYGKVTRLTTPMVQALNTIVAQDIETAERFVALGADPKNIQVTGSVKFDLHPPAKALALAQELNDKWLLVQRKIMVAASTHEPEERLLLEKFKILQQAHPEALLIVVPRHPERFVVVNKLLADMSFNYKCRSFNQDITTDTAVYLADTMGELWTWFALADMAFVGGSLAPTGGHNPLEPARLGVPVVVGAHTFNFAQIITAMLEHNAIVQVDDAAQVIQVWQHWLSDDNSRVETGSKGYKFIAANQGALQRQLQVLDGLLV